MQSGMKLICLRFFKQHTPYSVDFSSEGSLGGILQSINTEVGFLAMLVRTRPCWKIKWACLQRWAAEGCMECSKTRVSLNDMEAQNLFFKSYIKYSLFLLSTLAKLSYFWSKKLNFQQGNVDIISHIYKISFLLIRDWDWRSDGVQNPGCNSCFWSHVSLFFIVCFHIVCGPQGEFLAQQ